MVSHRTDAMVPLSVLMARRSAWGGASGSVSSDGCDNCPIPLRRMSSGSKSQDARAGGADASAGSPPAKKASHGLCGDASARAGLAIPRTHRLKIWSKIAPSSKCAFCALAQPPKTSSIANVSMFGNCAANLG